MLQAPDPNKTCGSCRYWANHACRRRAPVALPDVVTKGATAFTVDELLHRRMWPHVDSWDWCGDWTPNG